MTVLIGASLKAGTVLRSAVLDVKVHSSYVRAFPICRLQRTP
jgi:hypothetical protein